MQWELNKNSNVYCMERSVQRMSENGLDTNGEADMGKLIVWCVILVGCVPAWMYYPL